MGSGGDDDVRQVPEQICELTALRELSLSNYTIAGLPMAMASLQQLTRSEGRGRLGALVPQAVLPGR